jgi:hypothetical protein
MMDARRLLKEVAFAYVRNFERMQQAGARGDENARDRHFTKIQEIEASVTITERSGAWR